MILTPRQQEIAELVARGLSNKAIAQQIGLAVPTVRNHVSQAAERIPGDIPARRKLMLFFLGDEAA